MLQNTFGRARFPELVSRKINLWTKVYVVCVLLSCFGDLVEIMRRLQQSFQLLLPLIISTLLESIVRISIILYKIQLCLIEG